MTAAAYYLVPLSYTFGNDLWWPGYNSSGYALFLVDAINNILEQPPEDTIIDLSALKMAKSYAPSTRLVPEPHPTHARALLLTKLTFIEYAIANIRNTSADQTLMVPTHFCYVDFDRRWELAHSNARQARCEARYRANGAVYLAAILRNQNWTSFMRVYGEHLQVAVLNAVTSSGTAGHAWLNATAHCSSSLQDEAAHWRSFGVTHFTLQWQNNAFTGLQSSLTVVNPLNLAFTLELLHSTYTQGPWTSNTLNIFFMNEIFFMAMCGQSLVRGATNYFGLAQCVYSATPEFEGFLGLSDADGHFVQQTGLVRDAIGPFLSVDLFVVAPPPPLITVIAAFEQRLYTLLEANSSAASAYQQLSPLSVPPTPTWWQNGSFLLYGGNPMCLYNPPTSFPQPSFTFGDACNTQERAIMVVAPSALVFAVSMNRISARELCASIDDVACRRHVTVASDLAVTLSWSDAVNTASLASTVNATQVRLMQFASNPQGTEWTLLTAPILFDPLFGWAAVYDWVTGRREVVSFEGDNGTLVLVSDAYTDAVHVDPNTAPLSQASAILIYTLLYSSLVLWATAILCSWLGLRSRLAFAGQNLFVFHRVAGSTWLGRPMMLLRGCSAVMLLGTSPVTLSHTNGISALQTGHRPYVETLVLAGEATWISYALSEVLFVLQPNGWNVDAAFVWVSYVILETTAPVGVVMDLQSSCFSSDFIYTITCTHGSITIGSTRRVVLLFGIQAIGLLIALITRLWHRHATRRSDSVLLSGAASVLLTPDLDDVSCLLAGRVPLRPGRIWFDVKLWVIVRVAPPHLRVLPRLAMHGPSPSRYARFIALAGFMYVVADVYGSYSYLGVAQRALANDLVWPGFNLTHTHVFLSKYLWRQLSFNGTSGPLTLDVSYLSAMAPVGDPVTSSPSHFGAQMQYTTLTSLATAIAALRRLDPCLAPWVFTAYCYLDLGGVYEMAASTARQARCRTHLRSNAAVYMASLLRNVAWTQWDTCWGDAFQSAFGVYLQQSAAGHALLASFRAPRGSIPGEVDLWRYHRLNVYQLQWQNFKSIGLINTYSVENALGVAYPFTMQHSHGQFRLELQTTFKLYWSLANDFYWTMATNTSQSLLRASPTFRYANQTLEDVYLTNEKLVFASRFAGLSPTTNLTSLCRQVPGAVDDCEAVLRNVVDLSSTLPLESNGTLSSTAHAALSALNIQIMQYGTNVAARGSILTLYTSPLLHDDFRFFGYTFVHDWIFGRRDVVSFTGDVGTLTLLSDLVLQKVEPVQSAELPTAYALYAFAVVQYVTLAIASLAGLTGIYILASRGHIDGRNMLKLSRVGGIVWVGRPLLLVRSFTALCLLSTATLSLESTGYTMYFKSDVPATLSTCLAASEVTWLASIVNDIGLPLTQEHSARYVTLHSLIVLAIASLMSSLQPVAYAAEMDLQCAPTALDYQVTCSTARIAIGSYDRLVFLLGTVLVSNGLAFGLVRVFWPVKANDARHSKSFLLTAGAKFLFKHDKWFYRDVYYMDRASALLNGLVTIHVRSQRLLFDVKSWRLYAVQLEIDHVPTRLASGVPLHDASTASFRAIADCYAKHPQGMSHLRPLYP
ncbi:hypothetical protein SPRG_09512 [Saprolegnia parasitica CBS 223.65]|uniref:Uncharacterized protein n=1 Tax=Saprolegnia parasitica (strain CBS 223.65) TaxID=695850 RepID=A0A067CDG8_SAPPC|nr:hypothetical protein SPRG_09512 [Saprolegnia parasitica CBS 223.65]KDO24867.1 hypothetical protein SPRG_09512 [Saprolegnia parasitica CBS 223.65]|eukprot:XP_012204328.1 hypothetical protein SPRG_09512 [Saprolegnia parasitica CBS 223.65]